MKEGTQESRSSQGPWKSQHSPEPLSVRTFWTPVLRGCQSTLQRNNNEALKRTQWRTNSRQMLLGPPPCPQPHCCPEGEWKTNHTSVPSRP